MLRFPKDTSAKDNANFAWVQHFGYESLISTACTQLDWLLAELKTEEP